MSSISRARTLLAVTGSVLLLTLALVPAVTSGGRESACLYTGSLNTVEELDTFMTDVLHTPLFQGGDVGASVELRDGRDLFVFADTLRSAPFSGRQLIRNSMLLFDGWCARVVPSDHGGAVIPDRGDVGYWPMSAVYAGRDLLAVTAQRVRSTDAEADGVFAFEILGPSVAFFAVPAGDPPRLLGVRDLGPDVADTTRPVWGAATAAADGWLYLYGTARPPTGTYGFSLQVARTRPAALVDQEQWEYWDGSDWQTDPSAAVELIHAWGGVSQTLSVFEAGGRWYAVSKRGEVLGTDMTIWSAPAPTGPFSVASTVAQIPSDGATGTLQYMALAHPALLPEPGSVVVSYSRNNTDLGTVLDDPRLYRPRFLRVPLPG
ncbi:DUF4185 domain-containing protein [Blastococcus sp. TF02A-26]|uniref:DUF4185 domain-containing protein n=1 Tax=Blastococcus sp. TF02A-26 TaxID=2250577 RepID=UPI000DE8E1DE|nr:DUF4185 domain-containing protein [Blastococcus sp. TF02A-26]RBY90740.1 hypothetical protein DQ240_01380 [Blastococcus sp. TF02A-26]